jgi:hypothetical protein
MFGVVKGLPLATLGFVVAWANLGENLGEKLGSGQKNVVAERCDFGAKL